MIDTTSFKFSQYDEFQPCGTVLVTILDQTFGPTFLAFASNAIGDTEIYIHNWPADYQNSYNISQHNGLDINPTLSYASWGDATLYDVRIWLVWESEENNRWQIHGSYIELPLGEIDEELGRGSRIFYLKQNYPNPFNSETSIEFYLPHVSEIKLEIYNPLGQKVKTLWDGRQTSGLHQVRWDGRDDLNRLVTSGFYFCRLTARGSTISRKILVIK